MWDLVHEDTTWFSGQGVRPGVVRLTVGEAPTSEPEVSEAQALKAIPDTLAWRPSRLELWRIAVRMWAANAFFGVGPDNFRWTYGTMAGRPAFDTRVFANNMFLEFAATLGTFGLAAFCAALAFALIAGWREAPRSDAALIAL
jgi:O-antigen ligase